MSSPAATPRRPTPNAYGYGCGYRAVTLVAAMLLFIMYYLALWVWGWLFPPGPILDRLDDEALPAWATGGVPPGDASATFDAPGGWELIAKGAGAEAVDDPDRDEEVALEQQWDYDPGEPVGSVLLTVTFREGLADDQDWKPREIGDVQWERVDFHDLTAYAYSGTDDDLAVRTGSWEIKVSAGGADRRLLFAVAERVEFEPATGGEDDPDFRAMTADTDLFEVCQGGSFPDGAAYEGSAPHPTQVLVSDMGAVAADLYVNSSDDDQWPDTWPAEWAPGTADARSIQLVACVTRDQRQSVRTDVTCHYDLPSTDLDVIVFADPVVIREVRTGQVVAEVTATAEAGSCPESVLIELGQDELVRSPDLGHYLAVVEPYTF